MPDQPQGSNYVEVRFFTIEERALAVALILENGRSGHSGRAKEHIVLHRANLPEFDRAGIRYELIDE